LNYFSASASKKMNERKSGIVLVGASKKPGLEIGSSPSSSIEKAIEVLNCFDSNTRYLRFKDLHQKLTLHKGSLHRILSLLRKKEMIYQDPLSRQYCLGPKVVELAWNVLSQQELRSSVKNYLLHLRDLTQETAGFYIQVGIQRVCIEEVESPHGLRYAAKVGLSFPIYVGAPGKALLAFLPEKKLNEIIRELDFHQYTPHTITSAERLLKDLELARRKGYSTSNGERTLGVRAIAAPVFDRNGDVAGAICVLGPSDRLTRNKMQEVIAKIAESSEKLSRELGYSGKYLPSYDFEN